MTEIYDAARVLTLLQGAAQYISRDRQVFGVRDMPFGTNPYSDFSMYQMSPVGMLLLWVGQDPYHIEALSYAHSMNCPDEDDENCPICMDGGDTSIYNPWVKGEMAKGPKGFTLTSEAEDLLWEAEVSGLPLWEWLETRPTSVQVIEEPPEFALGAVLTLDEYQARAKKTAIYNPDKALEYLVPALAAEAGEVADKYAKSVRDGHEIDKEGFLKEIGDVLWMAAQIASEFDTPLGAVAEMNLKKLEDRQSRGVLGGSGDNR